MYHYSPSPSSIQAARHREAVDKLKASRNKGFEVLSAKHQSALATLKADAAAAQVNESVYYIRDRGCGNCERFLGCRKCDGMLDNGISV
jgi:primosomal protein N'